MFRSDTFEKSIEEAVRRERASQVAICAGVVELADAPDSKSGGLNGPCGFKSLLRHQKFLYLFFFFPEAAFGIANFVSKTSCSCIGEKLSQQLINFEMT